MEDENVNGKEKRLRYSADTLLALPELNSQADRELESLIREAHTLVSMEYRLKEIRKRISEIVQSKGLIGENGKLGARVANLATIVSWCDGASRLDRVKLVENGCDPEIIKRSMTTSDGYWKCELPKILG